MMSIMSASRVWCALPPQIWHMVSGALAVASSLQMQRCSLRCARTEAMVLRQKAWCAARAHMPYMLKHALARHVRRWSS